MGLIIRSSWIEMIFSGRKTWQIRGSNTHIRGRIGTIESVCGLAASACDLVDVEGPLFPTGLRREASKYFIRLSELRKGSPYEKALTWVSKDAGGLSKPVPYDHPQAAIIWVKLDE